MQANLSNDLFHYHSNNHGSTDSILDSQRATIYSFQDSFVGHFVLGRKSIGSNADLVHIDLRYNLGFQAVWMHHHGIDFNNWI